MIPPVLQIGGKRDPHVSLRGADRAMDEGPIATDPVRQQGSVLVLRGHDDPQPPEASKVTGEGDGDSGPISGEGGVHDRVLAQLGYVRDPWIFDAPQLFGMALGIREEGRFGIDPPTVDAVRGAGSAKVRQTATILHPAEQQGVPVGEYHRTGIEDAVHRIGPIRGGKDRVSTVSVEQRWARGHVRVTSSDSCSASPSRSSSSAWRKARVDSAP